LSNNDEKQTEDFILEEVEEAIKNLKINKEPGDDNISAEIIHASIVYKKAKAERKLTNPRDACEKFARFT